MMTKVEINLPRGIIKTYEQAQQGFSEYYYKHTIHRMRGNQLDRLFERFHQTFRYIVYAATAEDRKKKEDYIKECSAPQILDTWLSEV
jgi:hypothetical protein